MSYRDHVERDARLIILRMLAQETSWMLNEVLLQRGLETFGHNHSRDFVKTQLRAMADLNAVTLREAGTVLVATITPAGLDHVERRGLIEGIARPSPGE